MLEKMEKEEESLCLEHSLPNPPPAWLAAAAADGGGGNARLPRRAAVVVVDVRRVRFQQQLCGPPALLVDALAMPQEEEEPVHDAR